MFTRILGALPLLLLAGPAFAASDITVNLVPPATPAVYANATWSVQVSNVGNQNASNVSLTIALPKTGSSPTNTVLGILGTRSSGCSLSGTNIVCALGTINKRASKSVFFNIALPFSASPIVFTASATTSSSENSYTNNSDTETAALTYYANPIDTSSGSATVENRHCTGTNLTSWFICTLFPSSISGHTALFYPNGTLDFPGQDPLYTGTWSLNGSDLTFSYFYDGALVASFAGKGVANGCFEGITTFYPPGQYNSGYEVCP